jgi:hypothetical protein
MVNVLSFVFAQVYFPGHSNSLKDLATCLGFAWPDAALYGPNSIRSRILWESSQETAIKESLIAYNAADCTALQCLCNHLSALSRDRSTNLQEAMMDIVNVDELKPLSRFHLMNKDGAALPAFKTINKAAYWDYQRTRVYGVGSRADIAAIRRLVLHYRVPLMSAAAIVAEGVLMSYGPDFPDLVRRAASYVDRILRGAKPSELPVQYPSKFELVVNLKTAKAIGVTIPEAFLSRADEVIE